MMRFSTLISLQNVKTRLEQCHFYYSRGRQVEILLKITLLNKWFLRFVLLLGSQGELSCAFCISP